MAKIRAKSILDRLEGPQDRKPYSFYLSKGLMSRFKKRIGKKYPASKVIEEMIKEFLDED